MYGEKTFFSLENLYNIKEKQVWTFLGQNIYIITCVYISYMYYFLILTTRISFLIHKEVQII